MKFVAALLLAFTMTAAKAERILLVPLDSRPATGQFAQMIGRIANVDVEMPPYDDLGRFTKAGNPEAVLNWLQRQDLDDVSAVIVSADMVMYGGLIASRLNDVSSTLAIQRIHRLITVVRRHPAVRLYVFSATMRLLPTATNKASKYRLDLGRYEEAKAKYDLTGDARAKAYATKMRPTVPDAEIAAYENTRQRNHEVQKELIHMQAAGGFDFLVIGQDDARPFGPHVPETERLRKIVLHLRAERSVFFCEGVDQHASVLISRALLEGAQWTPRVRIVYSDDAGRFLYASFESKPIEDSLADQLAASGAMPVGPTDPYDYTLYLNTPGRREDLFKQFVQQLDSDVDSGLPVAVADIDLAGNGNADPELFSSLWENKRAMRLVSYAGWNTAGNTMGTAIPAANVYLLAKRSPHIDQLKSEVAQHEFLLHRYVNDFAYHRVTRAEAYQQIAADGFGSPDEIYGAEYDKINDFVQQDLGRWLETYFQEQFLGRHFLAGQREFEFSGIDDVRIWLPWPRAYEVRLQFKLEARPVEAAEVGKSASR